MCSSIRRRRSPCSPTSSISGGATGRSTPTRAGGSRAPHRARRRRPGRRGLRRRTACARDDHGVGARVRVAWTTSNDVTIEVTFEASNRAREVRVTGTVPDGVDGESDLSMVRMAPQWLPRYCDGAPVGDSVRLRARCTSRSVRETRATARWLAERLPTRADHRHPGGRRVTPSTRGSSSASARASS